MAPEFKYSILCVILTAICFMIPGGRVLVLPLVFILILVLLFWSARRGAERDEREEIEHGSR